MSVKFVSGELVFFFGKPDHQRTQSIRQGVLLETYRKLHHSVWSVLCEGKVVQVPEFAMEKSAETLIERTPNTVDVNIGMSGYGKPDAAHRKK